MILKTNQNQNQNKRIPYPQAFELSSSSPPVQSVGLSSTSNLTLSAENGFSARVTLTIVHTTHLACNADTAAVTVPGSWSLSCMSIAQGVFSVNVTASGGDILRSNTIIFKFIPDATSTKIDCFPSIIVANQSNAVCLADVSKTLVGPSGTSVTEVYSGSIVFSYNSTNAPYFVTTCAPSVNGPCFSNVATCNLDPRISCAVGFSASAPVGAYKITGHYAGDEVQSASSGEFVLVVASS